MAKSKKKTKSKPAKAVKKVAKKKPARKAAKKPAGKKKAVAKPKKAAPKKKVARKAAAKPATMPVKPGLGRRPDRDDNAGVRIAPTAPERITPGPKPAPDPLAMPIQMSSERPIASPNLRPAPLFERELFPHDDEE